MSMEIVKMENIGHDVYAKVLEEILKETPFALVNQAYNNTVGYFMFWDSKYVPKELKRFVMVIPQNPDKTERINKNIKRIIDASMS